MKAILIIFILLVSSLLACTTSVQNYDKVEDIVSNEQIKDEEVITRDDNGIVVEYEKIETDIVIKNTQLEPNFITIPLGNTTELIMQNKDNLSYRLEIPMYGTEKQREIYPYESIIIKLTPEIKGITQIKLGDFTLGTIKVE